MKEIFALDIGTRKVMGIIARQAEEQLEILDVDIMEHISRPMFDGQIHSIEEVVKTVKKIKENLESRLHKKLNKVGVAVAGRNLVTFKEKITRELPAEAELDYQLVRDLELEAVEKIIADADSHLSQFHCVGYSPVYYELNGSRISNLIGHKGQNVSVEVIATFLPRVVLDSIFAVLKKAGLELINITLEPIAAINAIIPFEMRHLNILLVDIGAGTSDLALTREGVVFAYGMVPEAGDEVTEAICEKLLVDFTTAERIKRLLQSHKEIEYEDIWGKKRSIKSEQIKEGIIPRIRALAGSIAKLALDLNAGPPQAVVGVGGGSLTYNLINELAASFNIEADKVGIRRPSAIKGIKDNTNRLTGPESVTPLGIAIMTAQASGLRFIDIEVNGIKLNMLDFYQKKDILGALILSGIDNKKLHPRPGLALTVKINNELKVVKGTMGEPAKVILNGKPAPSLSCKIKPGDVIEFYDAKDGEDASALICDLSDIKPVRVIFNQEALEINAPVVMNDERVTPDTPVADRASIKTLALTLREVLVSKDININTLNEKQILININNQPHLLTQRNFTLLLNGSSVNLDTLVNDSDLIDFLPDVATFYKIKDVVNIPKVSERIRINVDGKDIDIEIEPVQIFMNGKQVRPEEFLVDGADIKVYYLQERQVILSEIFRYIDVDPQRLKGKTMKILVNDQPAGFTTPLAEGSQVKILFEELNKEVI
ncbi:MAG: rod shape-determining protein [Candidatus Omnitrophica bacterium]|nr:rod shape-determining protein [Candidatus Omnitrophota bacterium]